MWEHFNHRKWKALSPYLRALAWPMLTASTALLPVDRDLHGVETFSGVAAIATACCNVDLNVLTFDVVNNNAEAISEV